MGPLSPSFPAQASCGETLLSHGPGLAQHQGPPEPQVQHSSQRWPGLPAQGSRCHRAMCSWAAMACAESAPPIPGETQSSGQGWQQGTDPAEPGIGTPGAQHRQESTGGLPAAHSPNWQMYRFRVLQRWSFQLKAADACISTQLPNLCPTRMVLKPGSSDTMQSSVSSRPTYPWLSGCPKAKLVNEEGSPTSQRKEALDVL